MSFEFARDSARAQVCGVCPRTGTGREFVVQCLIFQQMYCGMTLRSEISREILRALRILSSKIAKFFEARASDSRITCCKCLKTQRHDLLARRKPALRLQSRIESNRTRVAVQSANHSTHNAQPNSWKACQSPLIDNLDDSARTPHRCDPLSIESAGTAVEIDLQEVGGELGCAHEESGSAVIGKRWRQRIAGCPFV